MKVDRKRNEKIIAAQNVVATMAIEDMYFDEDMIRDFNDIINGKKTTEDIIKELDKKYAR